MKAFQFDVCQDECPGFSEEATLKLSITIAAAYRRWCKRKKYTIEHDMQPTARHKYNKKALQKLSGIELDDV